MSISYSRISKLLEKYPNHIPFIIKATDNCNFENFGIKKILIPEDQTFGHLQYNIRHKLKIKKNEGLLFFVNNKLIPSSMLVSELYNIEKNKNGYIEVILQRESIFG